METMNGWDVALLVIAGYVAVTALVRLMTWRREQLLSEFRRRVKLEKKQRKAKMERQDSLEDRSEAA